MSPSPNGPVTELCVIGDPVAHSKSPLIQNAMLAALGLNYHYSAQQVPRGQAAQWLQQAKENRYGGFNATMPHKQALIPLMDELSPDARMYGAVNTVVLRSGRAAGHNTDGRGLVRALADLDVHPRGRRVLLLGAGGAAKSVALKLIQEGARSIAVCNRTLSQAQALCQLDPAGRMTAAGFDQNTLCRQAALCDLVVNCTSLGMEGVDARFESCKFLEALPAGSAVYDLIYAPAQTELIRAARAVGIPAENGLGMLIYQAVYALELFTGTTLDPGEMRRVAAAALGQ